MRAPQAERDEINANSLDTHFVGMSQSPKGSLLGYKIEL